MPQDAFTLRLSAKELNETLKSGKINKILQPLPEEVSLVVYTGKRTVRLVLNANASDCGVYFSNDAAENPLVAPNFCMLLRKHLQGAQILGIELVGFERVVAIRLACVSDFSSEERVLYAEVMGKYSNLVLTERGVVLGALKTTTLDGNTKRIIFPGAPYTLPEPQDKVNPSDLSALSVRLNTLSGDAADFLFQNVSGLAPCTAKQIVSSYAGGDFAEHVYHFIFSDETSPRVVEKNGVPVDFFARGTEGLTFATLSEAQEYFYTKRRAKKNLDKFRRAIETAIGSAEKKHMKRLQQTVEKIRDCADSELNRIKGDLITANLYRLEKGANSCELENYYSEDGALLKISLDGTLSPAQNAQAYYKKYRKQKRTLETLVPQEKETRDELEYLSSLRTALLSARDEEDLRSLEEELMAQGLLKQKKEKTKKKPQEISFRSYEKDGFKIFAGRNNLQNDQLIKRSAPDDTWLHAQKYHSCHVVIKTEGRPVPDEVLLFAARLCALHSDGKGDKVPVDYCKIKRVKKPPASKPGFVIYTDFKTVYVSPLEE